MSLLLLGQTPRRQHVPAESKWRTHQQTGGRPSDTRRSVASTICRAEGLLNAMTVLTPTRTVAATPPREPITRSHMRLWRSPLTARRDELQHQIKPAHEPPPLLLGPGRGIILRPTELELPRDF
jgi:hypothetical protein